MFTVHPFLSDPIWPVPTILLLYMYITIFFFFLQHGIVLKYVLYFCNISQ